MELLTYRRFADREQAEALASILAKHSIGFEMEEYQQSLDSVYVGNNPFDAKFHVKIKGEDFDRADLILLRESDQTLEQVSSDHYLFQFTDQELYDVLSKPDEWNELDYKLAAKILKDRGKEMDEEAIGELKKERIRALATPESGGNLWILIGYLSALIGGALGIFIGWHLSTFKKTLPDGRKIKAYTPSARQHGAIILVIGIVMFITWLSFAIVKG
jgi:hypothetical protein